MATGNAELNHMRRKADAYASQDRKGYSRAAYPAPAFEPARRKSVDIPPVKKSEEDYHPDVPLKTFTPSEIRAIILVIFVVTLVALSIIFLAAEAAVTQKQINDLKRGITQTDDDIANLKIQIEQSQNMQLVKQRAQTELGMKEPSFDQYVYISDLPQPQSDFGRYIKEKAYGGTQNQNQ